MKIKDLLELPAKIEDLKKEHTELRYDQIKIKAMLERLNKEFEKLNQTNKVRQHTDEELYEKEKKKELELEPYEMFKV